MLIIDGADLVGKTTLAKAIVGNLNDIDYMHMLMHLSRLPETFDAHRGYIDKMSVDTVWDRFHLSEIAYRMHDDRHSNLTPIKFDLVEASMRLIGGYSIVMTADDDVIKARHKSRNDELYSLEHILQVNQTFIQMQNCSKIIMRGREYRYHIDKCIHITASYNHQAFLNDIQDVVNDYITRLEAVLAIS